MGFEWPWYHGTCYSLRLWMHTIQLIRKMKYILLGEFIPCTFYKKDIFDR